MKTLNQTLGYYTPAFFNLYIATTNPIELNKLTPGEMATFVHEYTHFLQDFTTLKGLENIFNVFEWLRLFVTETYKRKVVEIPVKFGHEILSLNQQISYISYGSQINIDSISSLSNISLSPVKVSDEILAKFPQLSTFSTVIATAYKPYGQLPIEIGTLAVMESMAHLSEVLMGLPITNSPDYPYNTVRLMANALCPAANLSDEVLYALCDHALQCSVPGKAIYEMLTGIQNGKFSTPLDGKDVYKIFNCSFDQWKNNDPMGCVGRGVEHLFKLVQGPMGQQYQAWVKNMMGFAITMRQTHPDFLIDNLRKKSCYCDIVNSVGTPLMVNAVSDFTKVPAPLPKAFPLEFDVEFYRAIDYIFGLLQSGKRECPMREWCQRSGIATDINCIVNPPARSDVNRYPALCPVGGLWRHWNLSRYHLSSQYLIRQDCWFRRWVLKLLKIGDCQ